MEAPANSIFCSPILYLLSFSMLCFDENLFTCQCHIVSVKKKQKGVRVLHFIIVLVIFNCHGSEGVNLVLIIS